MRVPNIISIASGFTAFLVVFLPLPVLADWQYTRWGMTPKEVIEASGQTTAKIPNPKKYSSKAANALLSAPFTTGRFKFVVRFLFDKKLSRLVGVHLTVLDPKLCPNLEEAMFSKYGKPDAENKTSFAAFSTWRVKEQNNSIAILTIGNNHCKLQYSPLIDKESEGL